jgi:ribonuclease P protein component
MLQKQNRLTKEKDFERIFKLGKSFFAKIIGFKFLKNNLFCSRFGFVVSNKIAKKATKRNRLKRQLREIIRLKIKKDGIKSGFDVILIARPGILEKDYKQLEKEIDYGLSKINLV